LLKGDVTMLQDQIKVGSAEIGKQIGVVWLEQFERAQRVVGTCSQDEDDAVGGIAGTLG
jgi:hypothetical protein